MAKAIVEELVKKNGCKSQKNFSQQWEFPNMIGSIDGKTHSTHF